MDGFWVKEARSRGPSRKMGQESRAREKVSADCRWCDVSLAYRGMLSGKADWDHIAADLCIHAIRRSIFICSHGGTH